MTCALLQCAPNCECNTQGKCLSCLQPAAHSAPYGLDPCQPCSNDGSCAACFVAGTCRECASGWRMTAAGVCKPQVSQEAKAESRHWPSGCFPHTNLHLTFPYCAVSLYLRMRCGRHVPEVPQALWQHPARQQLPPLLDRRQLCPLLGAQLLPAVRPWLADSCGPQVCQGAAGESSENGCGSGCCCVTTHCVNAEPQGQPLCCRPPHCCSVPTTAGATPGESVCVAAAPTAVQGLAAAGPVTHAALMAGVPPAASQGPVTGACVDGAWMQGTGACTTLAPVSGCCRDSTFHRAIWFTSSSQPLLDFSAGCTIGFQFCMLRISSILHDLSSVCVLCVSFILHAQSSVCVLCVSSILHDQISVVMHAVFGSACRTHSSSLSHLLFPTVLTCGSYSSLRRLESCMQPELIRVPRQRLPPRLPPPSALHIHECIRA